MTTDYLILTSLVIAFPQELVVGDNGISYRLSRVDKSEPLSLNLDQDQWYEGLNTNQPEIPADALAQPPLYWAIKLVWNCIS